MRLAFNRTWVALCIAGCINNFCYVVIISAAQSIARSFDEENLIGLIAWANVSLGIVSKAWNAFFLEKVSYNWRMFGMGVFYLFGLVGVAVSTFVSFGFCIFAIVVAGSASAFGESVMLGYMRQFPSEYIGGWSSGTGFAGVGGAGFYIVMVAAGLRNFTIFLIMIPLVFIYWAAFYLMIDKKQMIKRSGGSSKNAAETESDASFGDDMPNAAESASLLSNSSAAYSDSTSPKAMSPVAPAGETPVRRILRVHGATLFFSLNLAAVYLFEYWICSGGANKANDKDSENSSNFAVANAYAILQFCYQFGVLISRSSLKLIKIPRVEIITALQGINMVFWILQDVYKFMNVWAQFATMIYVGLLGGASYVNCFFQLLNTRKVSSADRELGTNIASIYVNFGIMIGTLLVVLSDNTFLKNY
jgi:battenin